MRATFTPQTPKMTNTQIIEKLKEFADDMSDGYKLTLEEKSIRTPTLWAPFLTTSLAEVTLSSSLGTLVHIRIFKDDGDRGNRQLAKGALKIIETFTKQFNK